MLYNTSRGIGRAHRLPKYPAVGDRCDDFRQSEFLLTNETFGSRCRFRPVPGASVDTLARGGMEAGAQTACPGIVIWTSITAMDMGACRCMHIPSGHVPRRLSRLGYSAEGGQAQGNDISIPSTWIISTHHGCACPSAHSHRYLLEVLIRQQCLLCSTRPAGQALLSRRVFSY